MLPSFLLVCAADICEALFVLLLDLLDLVLSRYLGFPLPLGLVINAVPSELLFKKLLLGLTELSELLLLEKKYLLQLTLFCLHFLETLLIGFFETSFEGFDVFLLLFIKIMDHFTHKSVWQILLKDLILLFELLVLQLLNALHLTVLCALLNLSLDLAFLLFVLIVKIAEFFLQLLVNLGYLVLVVLFLARINLSSNKAFQASFPVLRCFAGIQLLRLLLLQHGQRLFLEFDALLLIVLEQQVFQFGLMFVVDEALKGCWNLLWSQV